MFLYLKRFSRHYKNRRNLGQPVGHALKNARVRMHSYR